MTDPSRRAQDDLLRDQPWPSAVLFDMDGTLVDTEPYWIEAENDLIHGLGGTWSEQDALALVGSDLIDSGRYIREHAGIDLEPAAIVEELNARVTRKMGASVPWRPGAVELLECLVAAGMPCALVTMSYRSFVTPMLESLAPGTFSSVVTGDGVDQGKPHPEPYLRAARELGVAPQDCLAIEDSVIGTRSAEAAGCTVLVVPNHVPVEPSAARVFRESLVGLGLADLAGLRRTLGRPPH